MEKTAVFIEVFDSKQSDEKLNIPLLCFPEFKLNKLAFQFSEMKLLILLELLTLMVFSYFFIVKKKNADIMAPKISVVLCKLARMGSFAFF